ncbi:MAG: molybdopterin-dependent oxidoreductase [Thermoanaerobaculum sp.]
MEKKSFLANELTRRKFIELSATAAAAASVAPQLLSGSKVEAATYGHPDPLETTSGVETVFSMCLMCHSRCGVMAKVANGVLLKVDGSPYHPNCLDPEERLPYSTPVEEAKLHRGKNCAKSQAYPTLVYDPQRVKTPLKRVGPRGSGQWQAISWKQALDEIAEHLRTIRDVETPIDPAFPEFGPVANKLVLSFGRWQNGQKQFTDRLFGSGFGTVNYRHDHTSICEVSHHTAFKLMTDGKKDHFKPDLDKAEYVIWFGASVLEADFPMQTLARKVANFLARGGKMVTVDPRCSKTAGKSHRWVPIKPGTDAAFALGMARWIIENRRYDENFLTNTKADVNGEKSYTDATFLVRLTDRAFARDASGNYLVVNGGTVYPATQAPNFKGELDPGTVEVDGVPCRTAWSLYVERVMERTLEEYADICGIPVDMIVDTAREFAAHGKKAVANPYRGPVKHTNGVYNALAIGTLNMLVGNFDWAGGNSGGGGQYAFAGGPPGTVSVGKVVGGVTPKGIPISRHGKRYDKDAPNLFARDGFPAKRPWTPFNGDWFYHDLIPSIEEGYPYPIDTLITYWNALPYAAPAQREVFERTVADTEKIKLFVAFDVVIGEVSRWADYILPDSTSLERWGTPTNASPAITTKVGNFRKPVVGSTIRVEIAGKERLFYVPTYARGNVALDAWREVGEVSGNWPEAEGPQLAEDVFIALAVRLGIPGVGRNTFDLTGAKEGLDWRADLYSAWDWYLNLLNNISVDSGVPPEEILEKGGVFAPLDTTPDDPKAAYSGPYLKAQFKGLLHFYIEKLATTPDSMTGRPYDPLPNVYPVRDVLGREVRDDPAYPFAIVTYKDAYHGQARTVQNSWLRAIKPENFIEMNAADAKALGVRDGDTVRLVAPSGAATLGKVKLIQGVRPGVLAVSHHYGHWASGAETVKINGQTVPGDAARALGVQSNLVGRLDPHLGNVCLMDTVGGSAAFFDARVRVERV